MLQLSQFIKMKETNYMGVGVALGAGIGAALGVAFGNIAIGVAVGTGAGVAIGYSMSKKSKQDGDLREDVDKKPDQ